MSEFHSVIVIGGGLSGLYAAWQLQKKNIDVIVLEARDRCGGRILSPLSDSVNTKSQSATDLGPAWVWPQLQPRLQGLMTELDISLFKQFVQGKMLYERQGQGIDQYAGPSSHSQSYRISGGTRKLIDALQNKLNDSLIRLNTRVISIDQEDLVVKAVYEDKPYEYRAEKIILAMPLRLLQQSIKFSPPLDSEITEQMQNTPTWMAGHCKIVFIYDKPFWRDSGLSGEVFSQQGPLTEIYDGSPEDGSFYALTSFVGLQAHQRKALSKDQLINICLAQLKRLFGDESQKFLEIQIQDWSREPYTTTELDLSGQPRHPEFPENLSRSLWGGQLLLAGTETAREHGGYLEGALESADESIALLES